ncbi:hypothetical protein MTO96_051596 [Rhipicephalus appendiculatus]
MTCAAAMRIDGAVDAPLLLPCASAALSLVQFDRRGPGRPTDRPLATRSSPERPRKAQPAALACSSMHLLPSLVAHRYTASACSACFPHGTRGANARGQVHER